MSEHDNDRKRFVHVPLPRNPTRADIEAFVEGLHRLARENNSKPASETVEEDEAGDDDDPAKDAVE